MAFSSRPARSGPSTETRRRGCSPWTRDAVGPDAQLVGGTSGIHTGRTLTASLATRAASAHVVLAVPPHFADRIREAVLGHFRAVCEAVRHPAVVYNRPVSTGITFDASFMKGLSALQRVVAQKERAGDLRQSGNPLRLFRPPDGHADRCVVLLGRLGRHARQSGHRQQRRAANPRARRRLAVRGRTQRRRRALRQGHQ
ncbi:dihydrodipicolinate synthase family protein [Streptomyces hygroscopicus]|uniref:dihydrodipicolinate synthase family protein n=1 Tax=Streptomyces hygroscopicus TaxID=1912 RepID=UPI0036403F7C